MTTGPRKRKTRGGPPLDDAIDDSMAANPETPLDDDESFAGELRRALSDVRTALGTQPDIVRRPLFVPASALARNDRSPPMWLVEGLITRGGVAQLAAEPKCGKTWVATEIAVAVDTGTPAFGAFAVERGRAAYFYAEDDGRQVANRIRALVAGRRIVDHSLDSLFVCPRGHFLDVTRDEDVALIVASARRLGRLDLLVLDPLRDINSAAEDKSDEMSPVMRRLRVIGELLSCTVLVVHHRGKASADGKVRRAGQRSRGSSAIHGATDSGLYLDLVKTDGPARFELRAESEIKGARSTAPFSLTLDVVDDGNGEVIEAAWTVSGHAADQPAGRAQPSPAADDAAVLAFALAGIEHGEQHTRTGLREHPDCPIPDRRARAALDRLTATAGPLQLGRGGVIEPRGQP